VRLVHENAEEFADLVQILVGETGLGRSIIEKDYWVTHVLWALSTSGLDVSFKGGTSLSKGVGLGPVPRRAAVGHLGQRARRDR